MTHICFDMFRLSCLDPQVEISSDSEAERPQARRAVAAGGPAKAFGSDPWVDPRGRVVRMCGKGHFETARVAKGAGGFLFATFGSEEPFETTIPNLVIPAPKLATKKVLAKKPAGQPDDAHLLQDSPSPAEEEPEEQPEEKPELMKICTYPLVQLVCFIYGFVVHWFRGGPPGPRRISFTHWPITYNFKSMPRSRRRRSKPLRPRPMPRSRRRRRRPLRHRPVQPPRRSRAFG